MKKLHLEVLDLYKDFKVLNEGANAQIENIYCSDLMSFALGHIKSPKTILCTILKGMNVIAVAVALNLPVIIFCEGVEPSQDVIIEAKKHNITLLASKLNTYETAKQIDINHS